MFKPKGINICFLIVYVLWSSFAFAQLPLQKNLVPNGSFENYRKKSTNIRNAVPWQQIASVDYYQNPLSNDSSVNKGAKSGECFAGLRFQKNYKEFLQVKLAEPLKRGVKYDFEMHIRLGFWSNAVLKSFGAYISRAGFKNIKEVTETTLVDSVCKKTGFNGDHWVKISGVFESDGGEKYLTIGNFSERIRKDMIKDNKFKFGFKEAYYFVDEISLKKQKGEEIKTVVVESSYSKILKDSVLDVKKDIHVGDKIALKNIHFEDGHTFITLESYLELNKLATYLLLNPNLQIQINGHSDNGTSAKKSLKISEERARIVFEYLISKGVQNKMTFKGFGDMQPIASNDTGDGRALNRRVEFEIIKD
jgi:outer membrane protein OmpA-like peptidoglycan-associated protein